MRPKKIISLVFPVFHVAAPLNFILTILLIGNLLAWQLPALAQTSTTGSQDVTRKPTAQVEHKITSPSDVLIIQLKQGADRQQFDDLLEEVHGTYIRTISAGPTLQFVVVQTEPGKVTEVQQKLRKDKNVELIERNCQYRAPDTGRISTEKTAISAHLQDKHQRFSHPHPHNANKHNRFNPGTPPPPSQLTGQPDDPYLSDQWNLYALHFMPARDLPGVQTSNVAHYYFLDTGVLPNSDYPAVISQYDFTTDNSTGNQIAPNDVFGHGTATTSITAWTDNNFGLAGVGNLEGQRCTLTMCQISASADGTSSLVRIINALSFLANTPGLTPGPICLESEAAAGQPTINANSMVQAVAKQLILKNFLVVIPAGNFSETDPSPELYCRRVAGLDQNANLASFSNSGPGIFAAAPATSIPVYWYPGGGVYLVDGTSLSGPEWCAAVATVMAANPSLNASQADSIVIQTAFRSPQGFAVPNLQAALQAVGN